MPTPTAIDLSFAWRDVTLAGTLTRPQGDGPHPAVLMMQGSGPADRTSDGYFGPILQAFVDRGIATFAFDKPGCGASSGDWRRYGLLDRGDQATAAITLLRHRPDVDDTKIGIWGHSQGGWLAQLLASGHHDLAFAIAGSGPSITIPEQDLYGCTHTMRAEGYDEDDIEEAVQFVARVHRAALELESFEAVDSRLVAPARTRPWYGYLTVDDAADWHSIQLMIGQRYEPMAAMARIQCPFLAVYGALDVLVPAWQGAEETGRALREAGNRDATVIVFAGADHRILDPATGHFVPGYLDLLTGWAARRVTS